MFFGVAGSDYQFLSGLLSVMVMAFLSIGLRGGARRLRLRIDVERAPIDSLPLERLSVPFPAF